MAPGTNRSWSHVPISAVDLPEIVVTVLGCTLAIELGPNETEISCGESESALVAGKAF
jgi:hypothetical protein